MITPVKTVILGGGVVGVTTAYYLAGEGHEVTVVEQRSDVGQDATAGNAGLIAPGHSFSWATPSAPRMLLDSLRGRQTSIVVRPRADPRLLFWGLQFLRECTAGRERTNTLIKVGLARYSQLLLDELADSEDIDYQQVRRGAFYLYRDASELEQGFRRQQLLTEAGIQAQVVTPEDMARIDPAFAAGRQKLAGAIHVPSDASGNAHQFTTAVTRRCRDLGVNFRLGTTVRRFVVDGNRVSSVDTDHGPLFADAFVLALGVRSPYLARTAGQSLPVYPAKGYSVTVPVIDPTRAPTIPGVDERTRVAWSRFGSALRMSSTAEFSGYDQSWRPADLIGMADLARELFPGAVDWDRKVARAALRPMTPDGPPIVGKGRRDNLYYNTGHGHMGWTMACGSSRILADLMVGRTPRIDAADLSVRAFRR